MGGSRFDYGTYKTYATTRSLNADGTKRLNDQLYDRRRIDSTLDPRNIKLRESRDSEANPNSTPIILGLDVTGSMGSIAVKFATKIIGDLMVDVYEHEYVSDPHIMFMGIGDVYSDSAPLQVSQFEADIRISTELDKLWLEGGGGGNNNESYTLPWYFAANYISADAIEKRGKKGYLFTFGDECIPGDLSASDLAKIFGKDQPSQQSRISTKELFDEVSKNWNVFHVVIEEGSYASRALPRVVNSWYNVLGNRTLRLDNYNYLKDVIIAAIRVAEGVDPEDVIAESGDKKETVRKALYGAGEFV